MKREKSMLDKEKEMVQWVSFQMGEGFYAASIEVIQEIIKPLTIVKIPQAPHFIEGVINVRGMIIPIIDLKKRFEINSLLGDKRERIMLAEIQGLRVGFLVDRVVEVLRVSSSRIKVPPPLVLSKCNEKFIKGIVENQGGIWIVIDFCKIFSEDEKNILKSVK